MVIKKLANISGIMTYMSNIRENPLLGKLFEEAKLARTNIKKILIVDDSLFALDHFSHLVSLLDPSIKILGANSTQQAKDIFLSNKDDLDLVLMDYRLTDAASGARLTKNFLILKPDITILANSAMEAFNNKLLDAGAVHTIRKNIPEFFKWWISKGVK